MKKIIFILLGVGIINDAIAQNALDKVGLSVAVPATTAYSLRLLSSNYSGPAIQVRRSSDNSALDIGFTAGDVLDTASLKGFVGSDDGYITIWYDQSGNGYDAIQTSPPNQPIIVNAGIIERQNNSPYITYAGAQWLNLPIGLDRGTYPNATVNLVYQNTGSAGSQALWGCDDGGWDRFQLLRFDAAPGIAYGLSNGGGTVPNATNNTNRNVYTAIMDPAANETYVVVNGVVEPGFTESGTGSTGNIAIGAIGGYGGYPFAGNTSEFIVFISSLSTIDRETLETNQVNYYNTTGPVITTNPSGVPQKICVSGTADLGVTATGPGALSYQWYSNTVNSNAGGTLVVGATSSTYTPASTTIGIFYYYVVVSASAGSPVTSTVSGAIDVQAPISATVTGYDPTCLVNGSIVITNPQSAANDYITADFSALPAGATLSGSATIVAGECILTPAQSSQDGYIAFPVVADAPAAFVASFDYRVADGSGADGTSFNYGVLSPGGNYYEFGIVSSGLVVRLIEYSTSRVEVVYNGIDIISVPFALMDPNYRTCILTVSPSSEISLSIGGIDVFTNLSLPGSYPTDDKSSWQFAFASRCGGASNRHSIKNLAITSEILRYSIGGSTWQIPATFILPAGNYALEAKLGNATACPITNIGNVTLVAPALPVASISGSNTGSDSVVLVASGGVSYIWSGGNSSSTAQNTVTFSGKYVVTVTDADGCINKDSTIVTINLIGLNKYGNISIDSASNVNENGAIGKSSKVDTYGKIRYGSPNGLTAANAASNAYEIKQNFPGSVDGLYWIKNANINAGIPFQIYADMTTDGGGWTLILCNTSPNPGWSDADAILRNESSPGINSTYSIIAWADYIKRSSSGFQYMMDAQTRGANGGIWTANGNYSFVSTSNGNTNITLNTKFGSWNYSDDDIEERMPWYSPGSAGVITTSLDANGNWWGTLIASGGWNPAPWLGNSVAHPGIIWYWVR